MKASLTPLLILLVISGPSFALDQNHNGVSDVWESLYPTITDLSQDSDGDGCSNLAEGQAWTDPTDAESFYKTSEIDFEGGTTSSATRLRAGGETACLRPPTSQLGPDKANPSQASMGRLR